MRCAATWSTVQTTVTAGSAEVVAQPCGSTRTVRATSVPSAACASIEGGETAAAAPASTASAMPAAAAPRPSRRRPALVLGEGWRTAFAPYAGCITSAPTTVPAYLRQQLRWNKSYYRELLWALAFLPRLSRVMAVEVGVQALLPFLLVLTLLATLGRSLVEGPEVLVRYAVVVAVMAVLHCLFALVRTVTPASCCSWPTGSCTPGCSCRCASGRC